MTLTKNLSCWVLFGTAFLVVDLLQAQEQVPADSPVPVGQMDFFENRIRPVLIEHCYECHSQEAGEAKGGLRLDLRETVLRGGDSGPAIVPGQPAESLLLKAVRYEDLQMPPSGKLADQVIADLAQWVQMGAPDPRQGESLPESNRPVVARKDHWAFQPVKTPGLPDVQNKSWPLSDIDLFILARLEREGLKPVEDADRYTWLRRVSFDLTGLPPSVKEIREFVEDDSPTAFETVVERLLESREFGEHWARHWLDLVGYADEIGTSNSVFAEHAWRYRDYVIDALNEDKPFDRFIREQIAGDLLPHETVEERVTNLSATGFLVLHHIDIVEADKAKLHVDLIDQQVAKISQTFLGLTVGCARCHDHKFDPISQRDYYALGGFFHSTESIYKLSRGVWSDVLAIEVPETETQKMVRAKQSIAHAKTILKLQDDRKITMNYKSALDELIEAGAGNTSEAKVASQADLVEWQEQLKVRIGWLGHAVAHAKYMPPSVPRVYGVRDAEHPGDMRITIRGNPRALDDTVPRRFLEVMSTAVPQIPSDESGRRQLADWIASAENVLTTRVAANRFWQKLFGEGLVRSIDYFGIRGESPSHPELLDYLAGSFVRQGWSPKRFIRNLVLSRTYRMGSTLDRYAYSVDPDNRLLWQMRRRRLSAESLRDAFLDVSGQLIASTGGPAMPLEYSENVHNFEETSPNPVSFSLTIWRPGQEFQRTIYLPVIRMGAQPGPAELRNVFDFTDPAELAGQRSVTAVPTQALFLLNSPEIKSHARALATRVVKQSETDKKRLELLWLSTLNRPITTEEVEDVRQFLATSRDEKDNISSEGWFELCRALLASNDFLMRL